MTPIKSIAISAVIIFALCFVAAINCSKASKSQNSSIRGHGFVVLELFTSEGCSSCPPAEELLARIQQDAGNTPVYVLAYHVDYWNRLGWKDVFSNPEFSKRQYQYCRQLNAQVYTPQLIINGKAEFVGSDASAITSAIKVALGSLTTTVLNLQAEQQAGKIKISYQTTEGTSESQLVLAIIQKQAVSKVTKGENSGHTLSHVQIVRDLYTYNIAPARKGIQEMVMPIGFNTNDWEIIGLLQDKQTNVIKGAARVTTRVSMSN